MLRIYYMLMRTDIQRSRTDSKAEEKFKNMYKSQSARKSKKTAKSKCVELRRCFKNYQTGNSDKKDDEIVAKKSCNSLIYRALYSNNTKSRDLILDIASHCKYFSLSSVFISQQEVEKILQQPTPPVIAAFDNILIETSYTKQIKTLKMSDK